MHPQANLVGFGISYKVEPFYIFAYDFGEESRPVIDLQAWVVESRIPMIEERGRSRRGKNFGSAHRKLCYEDSFLKFGSEDAHSNERAGTPESTVARDARMGKNLASQR